MANAGGELIGTQRVCSFTHGCFGAMDFRVSKTRQVYHADVAGGKCARDLVESSIKCGEMYKRGGGWSMGILDHEWIKRFVAFRMVPILFYFDTHTDTEAHNLFVIQDDAHVEVLRKWL